ncbi:MAG TPA: hypothetical protein VEX70_08035 [Pyrinomonadaceae bacterium]|nr:hypothetical protein [Pyrinomonadaceae bacterium]
MNTNASSVEDAGAPLSPGHHRPHPLPARANRTPNAPDFYARPLVV